MCGAVKNGETVDGVGRSYWFVTRSLRCLLPANIAASGPLTIGRTHGAVPDAAGTLPAEGREPVCHLFDIGTELPAQPVDGIAMLFRCAQESLRNAYKHSGASHAQIHVSAIDDGVRAEIADDGRGFDVAVLADRAEQGHLGLTLIRDLVEEAGGRFEVTSTPSEGTTVRVEVPR